MAYHNYLLLFVAVVLLVFLYVSSKRKLIKRPWLKRTIKFVLIAAITLISLAVVVFPNLNSVETTGEYAYSSVVLELSDVARLEEFTRDGSPRQLSVLVYYPESVWLENNTAPLIVFSHGGISTKTSNLSLFKELASHGYVVASIDHSYHALSTEIAGKKVGIDSGYMKELNTEDSHTDIQQSYEYFQKWMKLRTDDINFVLDSFLAASAIEDNSFYSLIDGSRIGVAGHSLGGSAALGVARQRADVKAVLALESPYMCDITGVAGDDFIWNTDAYTSALLNIYSDTGYPLIKSDHKYVQNKNSYENKEVENYYIAGSNHYTLTDLVRLSPLVSALLGGGYKKSGYDTLAFINEKSLAFFDRYLLLADGKR